MNVILLEKVKNLGALGDTVEVRPGYARNFLIPSGKAVPATEDNMAEFEARRAELEKLQEEHADAARERADKLTGATFTIRVKAGDSGKLFGSVGPADVADVITSTGVVVEKQEVRMPGASIRQLGEYPVGLHLHADVDIEVTLLVEADS